MSEIKCPKCSAMLTNPGRFCSECGAPLPKVKTSAAKPVDRKPAKSTAKRDAIIIVAVLAVIVAGYSVFVGFPEPPPPPQQVETDSPHGSGMAEMPDMPSDYDGLVTMGNSTMDNGNFPLAAECYRRALAIDGSSEDVRTDFGACLHGMGLASRAVEEFQTVLRSSPNHTVAVFNLGIVYYTTSEPDSALTYFNRYVAMGIEGGQMDAARKYIGELEQIKKEM